MWGTEGKGEAAPTPSSMRSTPSPPLPPRRPNAPRGAARRPAQPPEPAIIVPFGPCPTVPAGQGIAATWLQPGIELHPHLVATSASRLTAVSMDMTGGYAAAVPQRAPQATIVIDNYHVVALATKALDEVRREHWNELRSAGASDAAKAFKGARWSLLSGSVDDRR